MASPSSVQIKTAHCSPDRRFGLFENLNSIQEGYLLEKSHSKRLTKSKMSFVNNVIVHQHMSIMPTFLQVTVG